MILISHRGNINGRIPELENNKGYIELAIANGYNVEIDIWWFKNNFRLGHDEPEYPVDIEYLQREELWCHAKNIEALIEMSKYSDIHYFWHQEDDITLTSKNYIWAYPGKQPIKNSIAVLPEIYNDKVDVCKGVCSDNIELYK